MAETQGSDTRGGGALSANDGVCVGWVRAGAVLEALHEYVEARAAYQSCLDAIANAQNLGRFERWRLGA